MCGVAAASVVVIKRPITISRVAAACGIGKKRLESIGCVEFTGGIAF